MCVQERETQKYTHALMSVSSPPSFPINEDFVQFSFFSFLFQPFFINCSDVYGEGTWLSSSSSVKAHLLKNPKWLLSFTAVFCSPWPAALPWPKSLMFIFVTLCTH